MERYRVINEDIQALEEKRQSLKGAVSAQKYKEIGEKIEEIKRKGLDLPSDFDETKVREVIEEMVGLQFEEFSPSFVEESTKEIKKTAFLQRLEHIRLAFGEGKEVKEVLKAAEKYWGSIEKCYDDIEVREVREKLDEIGLEVTLGGMQQAKKVDMSKVVGKQNGLLIRSRLQELAESPKVSDEDKLLIQAWLGESVDIKTGEIDEKAMERLVRTPKLWGVLAGVKEEKQEPVRVAKQEETEELLEKESEERKQEITEVCKKYDVDESKVRELLENGQNVWIVMDRSSHKVVVEPPTKKRIFGKRIKHKNITAIIYKNAQREVNGLTEHYGYLTRFYSLNDVVFPDNLEEITAYAFAGALEKVRFPSKLKHIDRGAFEYSKLTDVDLPDNLEELEDEVFVHSEALKNVNLGKGIKIIGRRAFMDCTLDNIEIPSNVKKVGYGAFAHNPLKSVVIQEGVKIIEGRAFTDSKLEAIVLPEETVADSDFVEDYVEVSEQKKLITSGKEDKNDVVDFVDLEELKKQRQELAEMLAQIDERLKQYEKVKVQEIDK